MNNEIACLRKRAAQLTKELRELYAKIKPLEEQVRRDRVNKNKNKNKERDLKIYDLRISDPKKWTYRKLGEKFGVSPQRIRTVLYHTERELRPRWLKTLRDARFIKKWDRKNKRPLREIVEEAAARYY
jgi:DNA-directed RNA polymerase sigma subunit (sigma70/sigma32)